MQKKTPDYDNVFKTLKSKHKRLLMDLKEFVNTIITHITNGNKNEERLVNVMGGTVIETESEKLRREAREEEREKVVLNMLKRGKLTIAEIAEDSGLSVEEVEQLAKLQTV